MPKKMVKKLKPVTAKKKAIKKAKLEARAYQGVEVAMWNGKPNCSKHVSLDGNDEKNGQIMYKCRFKDGTWKMIPEEAYQKFSK